jgi:hypothetical protein
MTFTNIASVASRKIGARIVNSIFRMAAFAGYNF